MNPIASNWKAWSKGLAKLEHAVIWLHGLGADGHDFAPIVPHLRAAAARPVRFVFPHAPVRPVTVNGGMAMRAWYDILGVSIDRDQDSKGILASVQSVNRLIKDQIDAGIAADRIVLAGFSQGGAIALRAGLAQDPPLAGVIALSCYLLQADDLDVWSAAASTSVPIFMGHGSQDPIVPVALGRAAADRCQRPATACPGIPIPCHTRCRLKKSRRLINGWSSAGREFPASRSACG